MLQASPPVILDPSAVDVGIRSYTVKLTEPPVSLRFADERVGVQANPIVVKAELIVPGSAPFHLAWTAYFPNTSFRMWSGDFNLTF